MSITTIVCCAFGRFGSNIMVTVEENAECDWDEVWQVERDICALYHEQAKVAGIDGDLAYGSIYKSAYWRYLSVKALPKMLETERDFILHGCLIMALAMAMDLIDGSGSHMREHIFTYRQAINQITVKDTDTLRLIRISVLALDIAEGRNDLNADLNKSLTWVNSHFIQGYFRSMLEQSIVAHSKVRLSD